MAPSSVVGRRAVPVRRRTSIAVLGVIVAVGLAGCAHTTNGLARLSFAGQVFVAKAGGIAHRAHNDQVLEAGDQVRVATGQADIRLAGSGVLQLRAGSKLTMAATPSLNAGDVLIQPSDQTIRVSAQQATLVVASGAAQFAVDTPTTPVASTPVASTLVAKVYQGTSKLDVAGHVPATIAAPREIDLSPDSHFPLAAVPLHYSAKDAWDVLYLGAAVSISSDLAAAAAGFNAQVPATMGDTASFYQQLVPTLGGQSDFVATFDAIEQSEPAANVVKPGDYLIASVIALRGNQGSFARRLIGALTFSAQGAPWGFVAYDQGVTDLDGVFNDVLAGIGRASLPFSTTSPNQIAIGPPSTVAKPATGSSSPAVTTPTTSPTTPTTNPTVTTTPNQGHSPTTPTTVPPLIQLPVPLVTGPLGSILNPLLDPLIQALNNILAGKG
jgi:hypothetical protein